MKILVRLSPDLTVKSDRIRARFVTRLIANLKAGFAQDGVQAAIERQWSRLYVVTDDPRAEAVLGRTFGVHTYSVIEHECGGDRHEIVALGAAAYRERVAGRTFAVRVKRVGDHDYTSMDLARQLGAALRPSAVRVDLHHPEVEVSIEVREDAAYLYSSKQKGPGGLPLGVSGRALCLFSGGFDSAVAAWLLEKRGIELDFVFFNLAGAAYERSVLGLAHLLARQWGHGAKPRLFVVDFQAVADEIRRKVKPSHAQVILKRMFYRAAERLAQETQALAIVTGECVGQVSSQTLRNLATIEDALVEVPVLRPVIGLDKEEILTLARRIGTFDLSAGIQEYCQLVPDKPVTACRADGARREEQDFDWTQLDAALAGRRTLMLRELSAAQLALPYLHVSELPAGAVVIDCRTAEEFAEWHHEGAIQQELHELLASFSRLDKACTYVLYCPVGLQSAVAAEQMQRAGYQAYSFKGGVDALKALAKREARLVETGFHCGEDKPW